MAIDRASWHAEAEGFPSHLPETAASTHIGMFFAWLVQRNLQSEKMESDLKDELSAVRARRITSGAFVARYMDGCLSEHDLNGVGKELSSARYQHAENGYLLAYEIYSANELSGRSEYGLPDTWETYDDLESIISRIFEDWSRTARY